ncbi:MAG: addiction module protein [Gammaproteobacteria bacterium]|nr:addiction module protein [Gammaproteobacteria bacterium]
MATSLALDQMTVEEKILAMESLWQDLCAHAPDMASPNWHEDILNSRQAAIEHAEDKFEDWETAKENIRKQIS